MLIDFVEKELSEDCKFFKFKLNVISNDFVDIGTILKVDYRNNPIYFKVVKIQSSLQNKGKLDLICENCGFDNLLVNMDIREFLALDVSVVTNKTVLKVLEVLYE